MHTKLIQVDDLPKVKKARDFIIRHPLGVLSTINEVGEINATPVYVYVDESMCNCFIITKTTTRKYDDIKKGSKVTLTFLDQKEMTYVGLAVIAEIITSKDIDPEVIVHLEELVQEQQLAHWIPPLNQIDGKEYVFFKIEPYRISYNDFQKHGKELELSPERFVVEIG